MAKVPDSGVPDVPPAGPRFFQNPPDETPPISNNVGRQAQEMGQTLSNAGVDLGKAAQDAQQKSNDLAVIEAENKAREAAINLTVDPTDGFTSQRGADAVHRQSGLPLAVEYHQKLQDQLAEIQGGLSNDVQRQAFARSASTIGQDFYGRAATYEASQYDEYHKSMLKGSAELAGQNIGLHYTSPDAVAKDLQSLDVATAKLGQVSGMAGDEIDALRNTARSSALTQAVKLALASGDTAGATSFYTAHKDDMLAPDRETVEEPLRRAGALQIGQTYGEDYVRGLLGGQSVGGVAPGQAAPGGKATAQMAWAFTAPHEGGYAAHDANGQPVNFGINQGANPGVDVKSLTKDQAQQIFEQKYWKPSGAEGLPAGLGVIHADTAFVFGVGRAKQFLAQAGGDPAKYMQLRQAWMQKLETDDPAKFGKYKDAWDKRNSDLSAYAANLQGGGTNAATGRSNMTLEDAVTAATTKLFADHPGATPDQREAVERSAESTWRIHNQSQSEEIEKNVSGVFQTLLQNKGDMSKLSPQQVAAIPAEKWESVTNFADHLQKPPPRDKMQDDTLYNHSVSDPQWLKSLPDSTFLHDFQGHPQFDEIARHRAILQGKAPTGGKDTSQVLNYTTINRVIDSRLQSLGVDTSTKTGPVGQIGAARRVINGAIAGEQRRLGRQLSDVETEAFVDRQMARPGVVQTNTFLGLPTSSKSLPLFAVGAKDIPDDALKQINAALGKAGMPQTEQNQLYLYYQGKMR